MARVKSGVPTVKELKEGELEHRYVSGTGLVGYTRYENQLYSSKMYPSSVPPIIDKKASSIIRNSETVNITAAVLELDFGSLISGVLADGDHILFLDATSSNQVRKEAFADLSTLLAGSGLASSSSVLEVGAGTGIDVTTNAIAVDVSDFMSSGVNNRVLTATGTDAFQGESNLIFDGSSLAVTGALSATTDITVGDDLLFSSSGAVINWNSGDITLTHSAGVLTFGGDGTVGIDFNNHEMTNVDINSGAIDGTTIGGSTKAAGSFTALTSTGTTTLGNASDDTLTINAATINPTNIATGTDNTVVVYNGSTLVTDEIDSRVWGTTLVDGTNGTDDEIAIFTDANSVEGDSNLTFNGSTLAVTGALSATTAVDLATASGVTTIGSSNALTVSAAGVLTVNIATDATSSTSGSVIIDGGVGIAKALFIGTDLTIVGGDIIYGNAQNATNTITATAHDTAGKALTVSAGDTTAGTTNNIAGGHLTFHGGQGKGSGAGGNIIFQTANAGSSGSTLNALATALTISDDISSTFTGDVYAPQIKDNNLLQGESGEMWELKVDEDIDIIVRQDGGGDYADHPITLKDYNKNFLQFYYTTNLAIIKTAAGAINLEINSQDGDISFKKGTNATGLIFNLDTAGACYIENGAGDAVVAVDDGDRRLYFFDKGDEYIVGDATNITMASGADIILDATADIVLDAAGGNFEFKDAGTTQLTIDADTTAGDIDINLNVNGDDLVFNQYDGNEVLRLKDEELIVIRNCYVDDFAINIKPEGSGRHYASGTADYQENYSMHGIHDLQSSGFDSNFNTTSGAWS